MKPFNGFKSERTTMRENLPAGGYVAKITDARVSENDWGGCLEISFDICEGEYKGFFTRDYKNNTADDKKWRGTFRINIPNETKSRYLDSDIKKFNNFIACVEETNNGFHWDWDEAKLKGKGIGVLFRNEEWEFNGRTGWTTKCGAVTTANDIREGKFKPLKDKPKANKSSASVSAFSAAPAEDDDEELPF